jgi:putative ABC transport system permease protein
MRLDPFRTAAAVYRRAVRGMTGVLPDRSEDEIVAVFDQLQRQAARDGGWAAVLRCWLREGAALARLSARPRVEVLSLDGAARTRSGRAAVLRLDLRDAWRSLAQAPAFTLTAMLILALGIGVNTALFSVLDALLFKTLPYANADRLMLVAEWPKNGGNWTAAPTAFAYWRQNARAFTRLEARVGARDTLLDGGDPEDVLSARVSPGYFDLLGVSAVVGRTFAADDEAPDRPCTIVVSHRLWVRRFGADEARLGRPIRLSGHSCTLIGVLPAASVFDRTAVELYMPLELTPDEVQSNGRFLTVLGRLRDGVTVTQASQELAAITKPFDASRGPAGRNWTTSVWPWRDLLIREDARQLVWVLFGAVALVLVIACVNVAGLSLSRAIVRRRELAVRMALGAGRGRLFRSLLTESMVLGVASGGLALAVGSWSLRGFLALVPPGTFPAESAPTLDARALVFTFLAALLAGVLAGVLPAWQAGRLSLSEALTAGGRTLSSSGRASTWQSALLVVEVALAMVLVTGATLLAVSFAKLAGVAPGFDPSHVLTFRLTAPAARYGTDDQVAEFYARVQASLQSLPSVQAAGGVTSLPLGGWLYGTGFAVEGVPESTDRPQSAHIQSVTPGYFEALRIPVASGRTFTDRDDAHALGVAIVNETFVRRFLPDGRGIGRHLHLGPQKPGGPDPPWDIVGVIRNVKTGGLGDADLATPEIYVPHRQLPISPLFFAIRSSREETGTLVRDAHAAVCAVDCEVGMTNVLAMDERIGVSLRTQRFRTILIGAFAGLAALLASLGVYAIRSHAVAARIREMGIRAALGARGGQLIALALGQGLRLAGVGLAAGLLASRFFAQFVGPWLFDTRASDPVIIACTVVMLGGATLLASWLPARRAASVDPLTVLRRE